MIKGDVPGWIRACECPHERAKLERDWLGLCGRMRADGLLPSAAERAALFARVRASGQMCPIAELFSDEKSLR